MTSQLVGPRTGVDARGAPETIYRCSLFSFLSLTLELQLKGCLNLVLCPTSVTTSLSSMDSIRVNRSELVGKTQNNTAVLEALICANALNRTGDLNFNENGKLDEVGFEKVSEKFIDNFVFCNIVPDYNTKKIKGKRARNMFVASQNKTIRDLLAANGFIKPIVKAVGMDEVLVCKEEMLENIPDANKNKEATKYYEQKFKIACPNMDYATVMNFIRNVD